MTTASDRTERGEGREPGASSNTTPSDRSHGRESAVPAGSAGSGRTERSGGREPGATASTARSDGAEDGKAATAASTARSDRTERGDGRRAATGTGPTVTGRDDGREATGAEPGPPPDVVSAAGLTGDAALELLRHGHLELEGRLVDASNTTLRAFLTAAGVTVRCVYKPVRGERPLWDFPDGTLAGREVAAYLVSRAAGWDVVPPTVLRDGPLGPGACQLWIDEPEEMEPLVGFVPARRLPGGWKRIMSARDETGRAYALAHADDDRLARLAVFDAVVNNADRKGGHVLVDGRDRVYGVDHGLCFHREDKLRTVLWGWADTPLPEAEVEPLERLSGRLSAGLGEELAEHLTRAEIAAAGGRAERLRAGGLFPLPSAGWPAVPWPPI